jgi:hypothetical protein
MAITNRVTSGREEWQNLPADSVQNRDKAYKAAPVSSEEQLRKADSSYKPTHF